MFLLNNIHDRPYSRIYLGIQDVVFDMGESQLANSKNQDWLKMVAGDIACVISSTRKISTFYLISGIMDSKVVDPIEGKQYVATGKVVAKLDPAKDMTTLFNQYAVNHQYLPSNKLSIGFNVADLSNALDSLVLDTRSGKRTLAEIKAGA